MGSGVVISPNITLTLSQVPVERAGSAGGVLQTGQRIGSAVGIAAVGSLFFNRLVSSHGDWQQAIVSALRLCDVIVALALVVALADLRVGQTPIGEVGPFGPTRHWCDRADPDPRRRPPDRREHLTGDVTVQAAS